MELILKELLDLEQLQELVTKFTNLTGMATAIGDLEGNILLYSGWQDICIKFHRINPKTCKKCIESDTIIAAQLKEGKKYNEYKCKNGLFDVSIPISIEGKRLGNFFIGQFLFQKPDLGYFKFQAQKYGFDEKRYINALNKVPIYSEEYVKAAIDFFIKMADIIVEVVYKNKKQLELNMELKNSNRLLIEKESVLKITKEKEIKVLKDLKESEKKYRTLFENLTGGIWEIDKDGYTRYVNKPMAKMIGYTENEMIGKSLFEFMDEKGKEICKINIERRRKGITEQHDFEFIHKNGKRITVLMESTPMLDSEGNYQGALAGVLDITEKKKIEEDLIKTNKKLKEILGKIEESEERLNFVLQGSQLGYWDWNIETNEVKRNERWAEILGYKLEEIEFTVKQWIDFVHPDDKDLAMQSINDHIEGKTSMHKLEYRMLRKDGGYRWILDQAQAVKRDSNNKALRMSGTHTDITNLKQIEEELIASKKQVEESNNRLLENERLLNKTGEMAKVGGWEINLENNELKWTQEIYNIHEVTEDFVPTVEKAIDFYDKDSKSTIQDAVEKSIISGKSFDVELGIITAKGNKKIVRALGEVRKDKNKKPLMVYGAFQDITEQKKVELEIMKAKEQAEKANLTKSQFLSNMSHEIRTPMNAVIGFSDLLNNIKTDAEKKEMIDCIKYSGDILMELINDILSLAKIEAGKVELNIEKVDIKEIFSDLYNIFRKVVKDGVSLKFEIDETIDFNFLGDNLKIKQILINLLNNAIKFTKKGNITLRLERIKSFESDFEKLKFSVKDTGIGIEKENIGKIFEKFTQENMTIDKKYGGTGLGLAIVSELVKLMNGKIEVKSEINVGTTFTIKLDVQKIKKLEELKKTKLEKALIYKKLKILIVEDNEINQKLIKAMLKDSSVELNVESDGKKALEKIINEKYDLILMDLQIPSMSGIELMKELRKRGIKVKIIVLSAYVLAENMKIAIEAGADDFIPKPIKKEKLISKINEIIRK